jgi:uncharacterized membrane protein
VKKEKYFFAALFFCNPSTFNCLPPSAARRRRRDFLINARIAVGDMIFLHGTGNIRPAVPQTPLILSCVYFFNRKSTAAAKKNTAARTQKNVDDSCK